MNTINDYVPTHLKPTALYRLYDAKEQLLYIGITTDPKIRLGHHRANQPWGGEIARNTVEWHENRDLALEAEASAIKAEVPMHNTVHHPTKWPQVFERRRETRQRRRESLPVQAKRAPHQVPADPSPRYFIAIPVPEGTAATEFLTQHRGAGWLLDTATGQMTSLNGWPRPQN